MKHLSYSRDTGAIRTPSTCFSIERFAEVDRIIRQCPRYEPTPLLSLDQLATNYGVGSIYVKDERKRFGLRSFKSLGGPYAVMELARRWQSARVGREIKIDSFFAPDRVPMTALTVICASAGNHGQGVAAGARLIGATCKVFLPANTAMERRQAIERMGAEIVAVNADYDGTVSEASRQARERGWLFVPDSSLHGDRDAPELVMLAYGTILREAYEQMVAQQLKRPTHLFIQAGVGGLAGSLAAYSAERWDNEKPRLVVVEPSQADCLMQSAIDGMTSRTHQNLKTDMTGLACGYASPMAWEILSREVNDFVTVSDEEVARTLQDLDAHDPPITTSLSGAAGLTPLRLSKADSTVAESLQLGMNSVVLGVITEASISSDLKESE